MTGINEYCPGQCAPMEMIYLDNNATTPLLPAVAEAMRAVQMEAFGNPASAHRAGRQARRVLEQARETIAAILGADPDEVIFTSGATEANNLAIFGLTHGQPSGHILSSPIEHPSVVEPLARLAAAGWEIEQLPVSGSGVAQGDRLAEHLRENTCLVCVMLANHETGAVQPISELVHQVGHAIPFHCDAVQAVGKIPVHFHTLGVTTLSVSAHKFHGPKGIGALLVRRGTRLDPLLLGGHQQHGRRPGTEAVVLAAGMAAALELWHAAAEERLAHVRRLRGRFLEALHRTASLIVINGSDDGVPHTLNISFPGCQADALLMNLDLAGVCCSTGSACSSGSLLPSPVLKAMGVAEENLHSAMRFSLSALLSEEEIDAAAQRIGAVVNRLRGYRARSASK
jgi:cysteine desulfurase